MTDHTPEVDLVAELAMELAVSMEHYQDDETKWFPEAVEALKKSTIYLELNNHQIPEPVALVLQRHKEL